MLPHMVETAKASGASQQKLDETEQKAKQFKQMYDNPAVNVGPDVHGGFSHRPGGHAALGRDSPETGRASARLTAVLSFLADCVIRSPD
jgi:hypothetical protein